MDSFEICRMSAAEMANAIKGKKLSPVEIMDAVLHRIEEINPRIGAYCTVVAEKARRQAVAAEAAVVRKKELGRLHGVPVSIKDLICTSGIRTTFGSRIYEHFVPEQSAVVVERLEAAGAIVVGKTNTSEFGWKGLTDNLIFGATCNPWNPGLAAGGSSGGAAAAIALSMGSLAIGSDGGGSIRIPSSFCGVFGFKPSFGRVPQFPNFTDWESLAHTGPITRNVEDAALTMDIIAGPDDRDRFSLPQSEVSYLAQLDAGIKGLRIGWTRDLGFATVDPRVIQVTEKAVKVFASSGAVVEEAAAEGKSPERAFSGYLGVRMWSALQSKMDEWKERMDPALVRFLERNKDKSGSEHARDCFELSQYWNSIWPLSRKYDLLLTPTVAVPPFELNSLGPREIAGARVSPLNWMAFTYPFNITGLPAATVPAGWTADGFPVGLQIVGRRFDDATVLRAAAAFEKAAPWESRRPPMGN